MKIEVRDRGTEHQQIIIRGIEGDMGEEKTLSLLQQPDGDVIVAISTGVSGQIHSVEFCTSAGDGRRPIIAKKLRELVKELMEEE